MPPLPAGTNVTHYGVSDALTEDAADIFSAIIVNFVVPTVINAGITTLNYPTVIFGDKSIDPMVAVNQAFNSELINLIHGVLANPAWDEILDAGSLNTTPLVEGDNFGTSDIGICNAIVTITTVGRGVDFWRGSANFARFGIFSFGNPVQIGGWSYLNNLQSQFRLPGRATANNWYVNLPPGTSGSITTAKRIGPGSISWTSPDIGPGSFTLPWYG
jgi:hypothetical protein